MKKLLEYEKSGTWAGEDTAYENSVVIRQDDSLEMMFRCVIRDGDDAVYSQSFSQELDEATYRNWIESIDIIEYDFDEINEESNLGPKREKEDLESLMPSTTNLRIEQPGANKDNRRSLWIRAGEASDEELKITWQGAEPHGIYRDIIGEASIESLDQRSREDWERGLPKGFLEELPEKSYSLYRDLDIGQVAEEVDRPPIEVFNEFYNGGLGGDEYVVVSGKENDFTLANPWEEQINDAVQSVEVQEVQHLHDGNIDRYSSEDVDILLDRFSTQGQGSNSAKELPHSIFGVLNDSFDLGSMSGMIMATEDEDQVEMRVNSEVQKAR